MNEGLTLEAGDGAPTKRLKIEDAPNNSTNAVDREVDVNKKMKKRTGRIYQAPRGFANLVGRGLGKVGDGMSAAGRLMHISQARAKLSSY